MGQGLDLDGDFCVRKLQRGHTHPLRGQACNGVGPVGWLERKKVPTIDRDYEGVHLGGTELGQHSARQIPARERLAAGVKFVRRYCKKITPVTASYC